jgi:ketosteroid isomerase-like protein
MTPHHRKEGKPMQEITTFLEQYGDAERSGDTARLGRALTDDFLGVGPLGFMLPKPSWLARHESGDLRYETFELDQIDTRLHGDVALVTARHTAKGSYGGHPIPEATRATLTLVQDSGAWQRAGIHLSFVAGTPGAPPIPGGIMHTATREGAQRQ